MAIKIENNSENKNKRVSDVISKRLDFQIAVELEASQLYQAAASWCEYSGLCNTARYLRNHADEEIQHMKRMQKYSLDRGCLPSTPSVKEQPKEFEDLVDVLQKAYNHEKYVSSTYEEFAKLAVNDGDFTTFTFVQWYLREQVEEETKFKSKLDRIKLLIEQGAGVLELDSEMNFDDISEAKSY